MPEVKLDKDTARVLFEMYAHQLPVWFMAERTGLSERQIRRHFKGCDSRALVNRRNKDVRVMSKILKEGYERVLWSHYRNSGYSYDRIARTFGRSKQAIQKRLEQ